MSEASKELREKFLHHHDDGIEVCEKLIINAGGTIEDQGSIVWPDNTPIPHEVEDAINFLCDEWDYDFNYFQ